MSEMRVVRHTDRLDDCCRFYGEMLGWPVTKQWNEPERGRIFGYGDSARIEFLETADGAASAPTGILLSIEVDDIAAVHSAVVAAGRPVSQPLADQPWGHRNFGLVDPTGTTVVLFEVIG